METAGYPASGRKYPLGGILFRIRIRKLRNRWCFIGPIFARPPRARHRLPSRSGQEFAA